MKFAKILMSGLLSFCVFSAAGIFADETPLQNPKILEISKNISSEQILNADTIILDDITRISYKPDGTSETISETYEKIVTEKGKRAKSALGFGYNQTYSQFKVLYVEIIKPDGKVLKVDLDRNSKVMISEEQMGANIYDPNHKNIKVSIPGLEQGDIIHYAVNDKQVKTRVPDSWSEYLVFESDSPIVHAYLEIKSPDARPLANIKLKAEVKDTVKYSKEAGEPGFTIHKWEIKNVPRMFEEPNMPSAWTVVQRLLVSTNKDWPQISRWYWNLSKPRLDAVTPEMKKTVDELIKDISDKQKQIEAIYYYVSHKIRYMGITTEEVAPGYEPHDVKTTFQNKYGVCRDKAALLVSMLRLAGFNAYPVLINAGPKKDEEVPNSFFNHAVVAVEDGKGSYILMDPTDENSTELFPAYLANMSYLVATPAGDPLRTSPVPSAEDNLLVVDTKGKLNAEGTLNAETTIKFEGVNDGAYRNHISKMKPAEYRNFFEGKLRSILPGVRVKSIELTPNDLNDLSAPLCIKFVYELKDLPINGSSEYMVQPPWLGSSFGLVNFLIGKTGLEKRKYPFQTDIPCGVRENIAIDVNSLKGRLAALPSGTSVDNKDLRWNLKLSSEGGMINAGSEFLLKTVEFSPEEYLSLKDTLRKIENDRKKMFVFVKDSDPAKLNVAAPDVIMLEDKNEITVDSSSAWHGVRNLKLKVMSYAGKKKCSEIKIHYNPAWESVRLISASVKDAGGNIHKVNEKEVNIMDAPGAAAAPRYPAGKILVVSLPGVDIGSEIEYYIEYSTKNRAFFYFVEALKGFEPIKYKSIIIHVPADIKLYISETRKVHNLKFEKSSENGKMLYSWILKDQSPSQPEDALPPLWSFQPTLLISSIDIKTYSKMLDIILNKAASEQAESAAMARKLCTGVSADLEKIAKIRDFIASNIRGAGPSIDKLPLSAVSPADITLKDRYGNNADKAVLFFAMLKSVGLEPEFTAVAHFPDVKNIVSVISNFLQPYTFNNIMVRVKEGNGYVYLNDTDQYAKLGTSPSENLPSVVLSSGVCEKVGIAKEFSNRTETVFSIKMNQNGSAELKKIFRSYGSFFNTSKKMFSEILPEDFNRHYQELLAEISQSAKADGNLSAEFEKYPGEESFKAKLSDFAVIDGNFMYFKLPASANLAILIRLSSEMRKNPYYISSPVNFKLKYEITLPPGYDVKMMPESFVWHVPSNEGGMIKLDSEYIPPANAAGCGQLNIEWHVKLIPALISPDDFKYLLDINKRLTHPGSRTILLEKISNPAK